MSYEPSRSHDDDDQQAEAEQKTQTRAVADEKAHKCWPDNLHGNQARKHGHCNHDGFGQACEHFLFTIQEYGHSTLS